MKKIFPLAAILLFLFSCTAEREVQADLVRTKLVKIDVVKRYPDLEQKMLTWRADNNVLYITYEPMYTNLELGYVRSVMIKK